MYMEKVMWKSGRRQEDYIQAIVFVAYKQMTTDGWFHLTSI